MTNMTTEELVRALVGRYEAASRKGLFVDAADWKSAADTIERQAEAIKLLRDALEVAKGSVVCSVINLRKKSHRDGHEHALDRIDDALSQTSEF